MAVSIISPSRAANANSYFRLAESNAVTRISAKPIVSRTPVRDGVRPVNLRTDLRPLADLIELVFADSMDHGGRSAIREMRFLSQLGFGLKLVARLNELALGISLGFVYVLDGKLVGNVSVYPAGYPAGLGETWILANVAVHPAYQRRGIANALVEAGLDMVRNRGAVRLILQVNYDNTAAQQLYAKQGFIYERAWRVWRRSGFLRAPFSNSRDYKIRQRKASEWEAELALAETARPNSRGGIGWLKPVHTAGFHTPVWHQIRELLALNNTERLVIRDETAGRLLAACWLEGAVSFGDLRAWLFAAPDIDPFPLAKALLCYLISRYSRSTIIVEHPRDDETVNDLLRSFQFTIKRELWHMRMDL